MDTFSRRGSHMNADSAPHVANILVVDDEPSARAALVDLLREEGFTVRSAADGFKALGQMDEWTPDLVITDVKMPGMDGIELMAKVRERLEGTAVVVMTAYGSVEHAVSAMQQGADDYLTKPVHFPELLQVVRRVLANDEVRRENARLRASGAAPTAPGVEWIGPSKESRDLIALVRQAATTDTSLLIRGEAGTGKELVAQMVHAWSSRSEGPFVVVPCAGAEADALERELFGYEAGAFAGATTQRDGKLMKASGGTLVLDDVGDMPLAVQAKLLRVLQEKRLERVGGDQTIDVDVRVMATSHRDLLEDVKAGKFREDLFYLLDVVTLSVPALAQRREDLPALAMYFLERHAAKCGKEIRGFSDRALRVLVGADWPGNVRQLENCIQRAVVMCQGAEIEPKHLPRDVMAHVRAADEAPPIPGSSMAELERYAILKTLEHVRGSTSKAAEILGISPRKIQYRLAEYRGADAAAAASESEAQAEGGSEPSTPGSGSANVGGGD
jgi:DNA-binding NtrC family response regulator